MVGRVELCGSRHCLSPSLSLSPSVAGRPSTWAAACKMPKAAPARRRPAALQQQQQQHQKGGQPAAIRAHRRTPLQEEPPAVLLGAAACLVSAAAVWFVLLPTIPPSRPTAATPAAPDPQLPRTVNSAGDISNLTVLSAGHGIWQLDGFLSPEEIAHVQLTTNADGRPFDGWRADSVLFRIEERMSQTLKLQMHDNEPAMWRPVPGEACAAGTTWRSLTHDAGTAEVSVLIFLTGGGAGGGGEVAFPCHPEKEGEEQGAHAPPPRSTTR